MAARSFRNVTYNYNSAVVSLGGGFVTNGAAQPTVFQGPYGLAATGPNGASNLPNGISAIARSGVGTYLVTFVDNFFAVLYAGCDLAMGTPANNYAQFNGFTNLNAASTLVLTATISIFVGAAVADLAAGGNTNIVSFFFDFKNSSVV